MRRNIRTKGRGIPGRALAFLLFLVPGTAFAAGGDCSVPRPEPGYGIDVTLQPGKAVVGEPVRFDWRIDGTVAQGEAGHAYLIFLAPETTRFEGRGFYAIAPGARGPHDIGFGKDRARAIVPLTTRFSASSGELDLFEYRAGETSVEWAVVEAGPCGEMVTRLQGADTLDVMPGTPKLVARDEFSATRPDEEIVPVKGPFRARLRGGFIEVTDSRTGEVVLQTTGVEPVFSPTGRFLTVSTDEAQISDVFDLVTERRIGRFQSVGMYWSHADSFLYLDQEWGGGMQIVRTLHGRRHAIEEAPRIDTLTGFRLEDVTEPDSPVHAGLDPGSEDMDPGDGAASFTAGSEAWDLEVSLEGGVVAFSSRYIGNPRVAEDPALVIDLGMKQPMIRASRGELAAILDSGFGLHETNVAGWNAGELRRTFDYYASAIYDSLSEQQDEEEEPAGPTIADADEVNEAAADDTEPVEAEEEAVFDYSEEPTQMATEAVAVAEPRRDEQGAILRSAVPIGNVREDVAQAGAWNGLAFSSGRAIEELRSGRDDDRLRSMSATLGTLYDPGTARFGARPEDEPAPYGTVPFPPPSTSGDTFIDLAEPGRDTWSWTDAGTRYWLTQTVEAARLSHAFSFTLLGADADGTLRHADLLADPRADAEPVYDEEGAPIGLIQRGDLRGDLGLAFGAPSIVSVVDDRYLLVATKPLVRLLAFDLKDWTPACAVAEPSNQAAIERIALTPDARHLVQVNRGGVVEVYSCADGARVLSGIMADGELVVMDENGYFDGSEDAAAYVQMKLPGIPGRQLLSQFSSTLRVPGLAASTLAGRSQQAKPAMALPPTLSASRSDEDGAFEIDVRSGSGLRSLQIFAGGRLVRQAELAGESATVAFASTEYPGEGFFTLIATDASGVTSAPLELMASRSEVKPSGRLVGLAVGIDAYPGMPGSDLKYAVADARRVADVAKGAGGYESVAVATLLDAEVTPETLRQALRKVVGEAGAGDTILLSFAGHGLMSGTGGLRLALPQTAIADLEDTSFDFDEIGAIVRTAKARVVILLDVCHAGASERGAIASNDDVVRQMSTDAGSGIVILSASKGRQLSQESASLGGGRFSVAFARAIGTGRAATDIDGNGRISLGELYGGVKSAVVAETGGAQTPWLARNQIFGDFDLF